MNIAISIIEDDVPAREILAGWIRNAEGFRLAGEYDLEQPFVWCFPIQ